MTSLAIPEQLREHEGLHRFHEIGLTLPLERPSGRVAARLWNQSYKSEHMLGLGSDICGAVSSRAILDNPKAIVSVDLDEVTRHMMMGIVNASNVSGDYRTFANYDVLFGVTEGDPVLVPTVKGFAHLDAAPIDEDIDSINGILRKAKSAGAIVLLNTASLEGTEEGTMKTLHRISPDVYDGFIFTGHYTQEKPKKKGEAVREVVNLALACNDDPALTTIVKIDDSSPNLHGMRAVIDEIREQGLPLAYTDYSPRMGWNVEDKSLNIVEKPVDAFSSALEFIITNTERAA